jgi:protein LSM14
MGMQNKPNGVHRGNKQNTLKFENEFDFEQANSKFEELRTQLAKLKVGGTEEVVKPTEQVNYLDQ